MSKKRIKSYIPDAIKVLAAEHSKGVIPSVYNGYISSFGASVIQSGLKPTLALFENENKTDRYKIIEMILKVLDEKTNDTSLLNHVLKGNEVLLKDKIIDISIALKLSIRTFKLERGE
jgi:CRISPR-associated protein Cmr5